MNKKEAIEKIKALKPDEQCLHEYQPEEWEAFQDGFDDGKCYVELIIEQIDESEKPVVPQFVADWYEAHKDNFEYSVQCLCVHCPDQVRQIDSWFDDDSNKPIETLVMMHKFGYEVKKEKLYTVELPNPNGFGLIILRRNEEGKIYISFNIPNLEKWRSDENAQLTESEIKEDFEWALQFKKEVEEK